MRYANVSKCRLERGIVVSMFSSVLANPAVYLSRWSVSSSLHVQRAREIVGTRYESDMRRRGSGVVTADPRSRLKCLLHIADRHRSYIVRASC